MKKAIAIILSIMLIMAITVPAAAVTKTTAKSSKSSTVISTKAFSLKILSTGNADDGLDVLLPIYKKMYPNAKFDIVTAPWGNGGQDFRNKQLIMISSGDTPDLSKMVWSKEFSREGILVDITNQVKTWDMYKKLTPGQLGRMTYNGKNYAITIGNNCVYLFYNKDILTKVGVTAPPKTLDEMTAIAKKIKDSNLQTADGKTIYSTTFEGGCWQNDYFLWANGGKQMNDNYTKTLIDSPESIKAFQWMQDYVKNGYSPKPDGSYDKLWLNGQLAFWPMGDWDIPATKDAKINVGYNVMPKGSSGTNTVSIGGAEIGVFKASKKQKEAIDLLKCYWSTDYQMKFARGVTDLTLYDNKEKQASWKAAGMLESAMAEKEQLKNTKYNFLENPYIFPDAAKIYQDTYDNILVNLKDPAQVLKSAADQINKGIADAMKN
jgi:ABC-type glycerol-3-phosphate transport system substrate-binding protein